MKKLYLIILLAVISASAKAQYTKLFDFTGANGKFPYGSLISDGTFLYGMTYSGGVNDSGVIFKIKPDGTVYTTLFNFTYTKGCFPFGSLTLSGSTLYGMTSQGGANNFGCIFSIHTDGTRDTVLLNFNGANGQNTWGSLTLSGNVLYGMTGGGGGVTNGGGADNLGLIFSIHTDGTDYTDLLDFNGVNGHTPWFSSLTLSGNVLYGMTGGGGPIVNGSYGYGNIFSFNTVGNVYTNLFDFNGTNGAFPEGSLILSGNMLYGMTWQGGVNHLGNIFSFNTVGDIFTDLFDFNGTDGKYPYGDLTLSGNVLYGMTSAGGGSMAGNVFSVNTDGTGFNNLVVFNNTNGAAPTGDLTLSGNVLYGMTSAGGTNDGIIFSYAVTTGINELTVSNPISVSIYPNPTSGKFTIENKDIALKIKGWEIYNAIGEKVLESVMSNLQSVIDIFNQPNGIYFLKVKTEKGEGIQKLIIQK